MSNSVFGAQVGIHVSKQYDHAIMGDFGKKKHMALSQFAGNHQPDYWFFSLDNFKELLSQLGDAPGVRVYLANYIPTGFDPVDAVVQRGYLNTLTLIFTATDANNEDLSKKDPDTPYFLITPPELNYKGDYTDGELITLTKGVAATMVKHYQDKTIPFLTALNKHVKRFYKKDPTAMYGETKSMTYNLEHFKGTIYEDIQNVNVKGVTAFLGSFTEENKPEDPKLVGQTEIIFGYASSFSYAGKLYYFHFDIEECPGFSEGFPTNPGEITNGNNTVNPCPPNDCPGASIP